MIWLIVLLTLIFSVSLANLMLRVIQRDKADHAKCIAHIASVTSNRIVALRLRELADRYESIDGAAELAQIRTMPYFEGMAIPAIWLRAQAEQIDPTEFNRNEVAW